MVNEKVVIWYKLIARSKYNQELGHYAHPLIWYTQVQKILWKNHGIDHLATSLKLVSRQQRLHKRGSHARIDV